MPSNESVVWGQLSTRIPKSLHRELKLHCVNLNSHPEGHRFRTLLREANREPVNSAGHSRIVEVGCGTSCAGTFIID